jgi:Undecaprenyl-phosphate galactose phosphotransferase WbaP
MATTAIQRIHAAPARPRRITNMTLCLLAADTVTLFVSVAISLCASAWTSGLPSWAPYLRLWPFLFVFLAVYALAGLYTGLALSPPEELRRATFSSVIVFVVLGAATVSLRGANRYFTWAMLLAILLSVLLLPVSRATVRIKFAREPWWGSPAVIFGAGETGQRIAKSLMDQPGLGLKPMAIVDDDPQYTGFVRGIPVLRSFELAAMGADSYASAYAVVAMPGLPSARFLAMIEKCGLHFTRILMIPNFANIYNLGASPKNVGGMLALEVCHDAFLRERHWPKRVLDLSLTALGAVIVLPLIAILALWIKADSSGPVFYSQRRIGQDSREFQAWKFRSMVENADEILEQYLQENPSLRDEWERAHKLRNDPRITRAGRFLRATSLDELPQLWNVLKGEMSLVGPRPIVAAEIPKYGNQFSLYTKVKSGLTGMWQISGRSDTSYDERVQLDSFYVRNWSVWLDLYILFRTVEIVAQRKGAY